LAPLINPNKIVPRVKEQKLINCMQITLVYNTEYPGIGFKNTITEKVVEACRRDCNEKGRLVMKINKSRTKVVIWLEINGLESVFGNSIYQRILDEYTFDKIEKAYLSFNFEPYEQPNNIIKQNAPYREDGKYISGEEPQQEIPFDYYSFEESRSFAKINQYKNHNSESMKMVLTDSSESDNNKSQLFGRTIRKRKQSIASTSHAIQRTLAILTASTSNQESFDLSTWIANKLGLDVQIAEEKTRLIELAAAFRKAGYRTREIVNTIDDEAISDINAKLPEDRKLEGGEKRGLKKRNV